MHGKRKGKLLKIHKPHRAMFLTLILFGLAACQAMDVTTSRPLVLPSGTLNKIEAFKLAMQADNFILEGALEAVDMNACEHLPTCFGNNPTSPYLKAVLPRSPRQSFADDYETNGMSTVMHMSSDEALVFIGTSPPEVQYFGFTGYVIHHTVGVFRKMVFASTSDSVNNAHLELAGLNPFEQEMAVIMTASQDADRLIRDQLVKNGFLAESIFTIPIPDDVLKLGHAPRDDDFSLFLRVANFKSELEKQEFLNSPTFSAFRIIPKRQLKGNTFRNVKRTKRGTGTDEFHLQASLENLKKSVFSQFSGYKVTDLNNKVIKIVGPDCIRTGFNCNGDSPDTNYTKSDSFTLKENDFLILMGVNHVVTGKSSYSNATIQNVPKSLGVVSAVVGSLTGSADSYIPGDSNRSQLFVLKVARDCNREVYCLEVPSTGFPSLPLDSQAWVMERTYLEKATLTAPHWDEIIFLRLFILGKIDIHPQANECKLICGIEFAAKSFVANGDNC